MSSDRLWNDSTKSDQYKFSWNAFPVELLKAMAKELRVDDRQLADHLVERFGNRPTAELVRACPNALIDQWLVGDPHALDEVRAAGGFQEGGEDAPAGFAAQLVSSESACRAAAHWLWYRGLTTARPRVKIDQAEQSRKPDIDPRLGWTDEELQPLTPASLRLILTRDLRTEPAGRTKAALRKQIQSEQQNRTARGHLCWRSWDVEDVLLYNPTAARQGRTIIKTLEGVSDWADLRRLVEADDPAADYATDFLWELWESGYNYEEFGFDKDSEAIDEISNIEDLLHEVPPEMPLELANLDDDSECRFVDPFSPWQMGVPWLIINRYCGERFSMTSNWTATWQKDLPSVKKTAHALGWSLRKGREIDLKGLL